MKQQNVKSIFLLSSVSYCRYPSTHHTAQLVIFVGALSEVCPGLLIASYPVCTALTGLLGTLHTIIIHSVSLQPSWNVKNPITHKVQCSSDNYCHECRYVLKRWHNVCLTTYRHRLSFNKDFFLLALQLPAYYFIAIRNFGIHKNWYQEIGFAPHRPEPHLGLFSCYVILSVTSLNSLLHIATLPPPLKKITSWGLAGPSSAQTGTGTWS